MGCLVKDGLVPINLPLEVGGIGDLWNPPLHCRMVRIENREILQGQLYDAPVMLHCAKKRSICLILHTK